jgi:DNA-binding transcriptional MocR family regulator
MLATLAAAMPERVNWTRPAGGMFVWLTIPETLDASRLLATAMARGVIFVPGAGFHPDGRGANTLRLNFVSASPERIEAGVRVLAGVIDEALTTA